MPQPTSKSIRIYFESLEQACHLIEPLIRQSLRQLGSDMEIFLIRGNWPPSKSVGPIDAFRLFNTPDVLITLVCGGGNKSVEYPLIAVEFSEAVKTEDHELQRATVAVASMWSGIPAIKISGERTSSASHGGNKNFDPHVVAKLFQESVGTRTYFYQEWPSKNGKLLHQKDATSCPPISKVPLLESLINAACKVAVSEDFSNKQFDDVLASLMNAVEKDTTVKKYRIKVQSSEADAGSMVDRVLNPDETNINPKDLIKDRVVVGKNRTLFIKMNRFDHAGDPDRGVLEALSTGWNGAVCITYRIEGKGKTINKPALKRIFNNAQSVNTAFKGFASAEGMPNWFCDLATRGEDGREVDVSEDFEENWIECTKSTLIRAMLLFSDGILVQMVRNDKISWIKLKWDRERVLRLLGPKDSRVAQSPRAIARALQANEDEVTYVTTHRVLKPNNFNIINVSYPGHQAGGAILNESEHGRIRSREYVDIVAVTPTETVPSLTEAKASAKAGIEKDIKKLVRISKTTGLISGLDQLLKTHGYTNWNGKKVVLSVAFSSNSMTRWRPDNIDFIVRLNGRERFSVAPFGNARDYFSIVEGSTNLPEVYDQT